MECSFYGALLRRYHVRSSNGRPRIVKGLISRSEPISSSIDHCHPSWFLIRKRTGRAIDDLRSQLVSSPSGVAINKAFASAGADKLQPDSRTPRHDHQFTRRLGGSNVIVHLTSHDIRQARHDAFPWLGETTRCWTSLGDFARYGNALHILSSPAARSVRQRE